MPTHPKHAKPPSPPASLLAVPFSFAELLADDATADWKLIYPTAQGAQSKPGSKGHFLLVAEVSAILRRNEATVRDYLLKGALVGHRVGGHWRVYEADLNGFISAKPASAAPHLRRLDLSAATGPAAASISPAPHPPTFLEGATVKPEGGAI
jgi:excisionase family DNA binding protein